MYSLSHQSYLVNTTKKGHGRAFLAVKGNFNWGNFKFGPDSLLGTYNSR